MAVKTIIVGIGTEGYKACELVVQRLESQFGSLDRVPWIRFIVLDTENQSVKKLGRAGLASHIGLDASTWTDVNRNPSTYDASIELTTWANHDLKRFGSMGPHNGANNNRSLGRLCFLYPDNFVQFCDNLDEAAGALSDLTEPKASMAHGNSVTFEKVGPKHGPKKDMFNVFVIGTSTGGTGSGCMIDVGYALRTSPALKDKAEVIGIASIPAENYAKDGVHWANAYAFLTELNHYHYPRAEYRAKFGAPAKYPEPIELSGVPPFDYTMIVQPKDATEESLNLMRIGVAEFLALETVDVHAGQVTANLTNMKGQYNDWLDRKGRPMPYFSLGVSKLEYPVDHIAEGIVGHFAAEALESLLEKSDADPAEIDYLMDELKVSPKELAKAFIETEGGKRVYTDWVQRVKVAVDNATKGDVRHLSELLVQLDEFVGLSGSATGQLKPELEEAGRQLRDAVVPRFAEKLTEKMLDGSRGPKWTRSALKLLKKAVDDRIDAIDSPDIEVGLHAEYRMSRGKLESLSREFTSGGAEPGKPVSWVLPILLWVLFVISLVALVLRVQDLWLLGVDIPLLAILSGGLGIAATIATFSAVGAKRRAEEATKERSNRLAKTREESIRHAEQTLRIALSIRSTIPEREILQGLKSKLPKWIKRLDDPSLGACPLLERLKVYSAQMYEERNKRGPLINGHAVFEPQVTIPNLLNDEFGDDRTRKEARAKVLDTIEPDLRSIFAKDSRFDFGPPELDEDFRRFVGAFHTLLIKLRSTDVGEELERTDTANWESVLTQARERSLPMVSVNHAENQLGPPPVGFALRNPCFVRGKGLENPTDRVRQAIPKHFVPGKDAKAAGGSTPAQDSDSTRLLFVQALGIFSLYSIRGIPNLARPNFTENRLTRFDVVWKHLDGTMVDAQFRYHAGLILVGLALGQVKMKRTELTFDIPSGPGSPASEYRLSLDLAKASYLLTQNPDKSRLLDKRVKAMIEQDQQNGVIAVAQDSHKLTQDKDQPGVLRYRDPMSDDGLPITGEAYVQYAMEYIEQFPGMAEAWWALHPDWPRPTVKDLLTTLKDPIAISEGHSIRSVYQCPRCKTIFCWEGEPHPENLVPHSCSTCGWKLRYD